mgnify:CR=1 FL=1
MRIQSLLAIAMLVGAAIFGLLEQTDAQNGPILVDPDTGKFLGNLNNNPYDPYSVANPYGPYGSRYPSDSANNPYGRYGSPYSPDSARNPYTSGGPAI